MKLTRKERCKDKARLRKDDGKEDGVCRLAMFGNDGTQVLVQVQNKIGQPCNAISVKQWRLQAKVSTPSPTMNIFSLLSLLFSLVKPS